MTPIRRWDRHTIDLTAMTGRELQTIRAVNAHQTQRERRHAIKRALRAWTPLIRMRR